MLKQDLPSYRLPKLHQDQARLYNALCIRQSPWTFAVGNAKARFDILPETPVFAPAAALTLEIEGERWVVELSSLEVICRHPALAEFQDISGQLPETVQAALLDTLFHPLVDQVQQGLGTTVSLVDVQIHPDSVQGLFALGATMELSAYEDKPALSMILRLVPEKFEQILPRLRPLPLRQNGIFSAVLEDIPLETMLEAGYLQLNVQEAACLAPGDVLLPDVWTLPEGKLLLRLPLGHAGWMSASCSFHEGHAELTSPLAFDTEPSMDDDIKQDLDVRLSFELERRTITVRELAALAPGYVFSLDADIQAPVTLRANGKAIGRGRLVDMGGTLGVQLTETM